MAILKLQPACKDYLWGGTRLMKEYHKSFNGEKLAETWELSCHPDGPSTIVNGMEKGKTLDQYLEEKGNVVLGSNSRDEKEFPILVKLIDAKDDLSVQVHPDDLFALANEGQKGKTEVWYIIDCEEGAFLYYGFSKKISKEEFQERIQNHTLVEVLNRVYVKKGDVLLIESGTIHAIGKNILLAEIQENSNVTYRIYDYGRIGKDGKERRLDIDKALDVTDLSPIVKEGSFCPHLVTCRYFTVDKIYLDGVHMQKLNGFVGQDSFVHLLVLEGEGTIETSDDIVSVQKGDSVFLPAGSGKFEISGSLEALMTRV